MNKKTLLIWILILVVIVLGAMYLNSQVPQPGPVVQNTQETATTTEPVATSTPTTTSSVPKTTSSTPSRPLIAKDGTYLVYYTNSGFYPKTVSITRGKSVRFINQSNRAMRISPALPNDPQFGALHQDKTVGYNGVFDFNFSIAGAWGYYNENMTTHNGVVLVK